MIFPTQREYCYYQINISHSPPEIFKGSSLLKAKLTFIIQDWREKEMEKKKKKMFVGDGGRVMTISDK